MKILAYLETQEGAFKKNAFEAIKAARHIAELTGGECIGATCGIDAANIQEAGKYGLETCFTLDHAALAQPNAAALAQAVSGLAEQETCQIVVFSATALGKETAPRVAVRLQAGIVADTIDIQREGDCLVAVKPVYAGKALATIKIEAPQQVYTIRPNIFTATADASATVTVNSFAPTLDDVATRTTVTGVTRNTGKLDVAEAEIIVSGGRGLKGPENFYLIEELARAFGAAVGASRAVVDAGWRPHAEQVGQTGKTVSPNLYVACGISGAVQHLAGMSSSKNIVAVNKDKNAPIFQVADYGVVGDVFEVLPVLTKLVSETTGNKIEA